MVMIIVRTMEIGNNNKSIHIKQEVQLQWPPAFNREKVGYQSNQKLFHHYQHLNNQVSSYNSYINS